MDYSLAVGVLVYLTFLILLTIWIAHKAVRVIDFVCAIAGKWQTEKAHTDALHLKA